MYKYSVKNYEIKDVNLPTLSYILIHELVCDILELSAHTRVLCLYCLLFISQGRL